MKPTPLRPRALGLRRTVALFVPLALLSTVGPAVADAPAARARMVSATIDVPRLERPPALPLAGSTPPPAARFALVAGASAMDLSPDGRRVAFVSAVGGTPQAWVVDAEGGAAHRIGIGFEARQVRWTPDGAGLVVETQPGGDERSGIVWIAADGRTERTLFEPSTAWHRFGGFSADGRWLYDLGDSRQADHYELHAVELATGKRSVITSVTAGDRSLVPSPAGSRGLMVRARSEETSDLLLVDLAAGAVTPLFAPKETASWGRPFFLAPRAMGWEPDGQGFYAATNEGRDLVGIAHVDLRTRAVRWVETPDEEVADMRLSRDGRYLVWVTLAGGFSRLHVRDLATQRLLDVPPLPAGYYEIALARDAAALAVLVDGPRSPGEVFVWRLDSGRVTQAVAAEAAGMDLAAMVVPEVLRFPARDGAPLSALLYRPPVVCGGKAPILLTLHGGPTDYAFPGYDAVTQFVVARGVAVLDVNYRGSWGAGKTLTQMNNRRGRAHEPDDVADAIAFVRNDPRLDAQRVIVGGHSYGGYLALASALRYPGLFVGAISTSGPVDWVRNLREVPPWIAVTDRIEYGDVNDPEDRAFLAQISPASQVDRLRVPLLVRQGLADLRVPPGATDEFVRAAQATGAPVRYLRYADEGHGLARPASLAHYTGELERFLQDRFNLGAPAGCPVVASGR